MLAPPDEIIYDALQIAREKRCMKSHRGAVVFRTGIPPLVYGLGYNGPPPGFACDGSAACRAACRHLCEHAEARAVRHALEYAQRDPFDLVHVKADAAGQLVAGGGPSCAPCSRLILDSRIIAGVWLYETMPEEWCPHLDMLRVNCPLCQGDGCARCHPDPGHRPHCDHDVLDRHHGYPTVDARWRRYTADEFHERSLRASKLPVIRVSASGSSR